MISTERQCKLAQDKLALLTARLDDPAEGRAVPAVVLNKLRADLQDSIEKLQSDIAVYDLAMRADLDNLELESWDSLPMVPIIVRLKRHMTVRDFASYLGVAHTQIARWEKQCYRQCTVQKLNTIIATLKEKGLFRSVSYKAA